MLRIHLCGISFLSLTVVHWLCKIKLSPAQTVADTLVTWTGDGNQSSCQAVVTVQDTSLPTALGQTVFGYTHVGSNTVTLYVEDPSANISSCTAVVTVLDQTPPTALCQPLTVSLDGNGEAMVTGSQVNANSSDACGVASLTLSTAVFGCGELGANPVVLTVTDVNGNTSTCTSVVTVTDQTGPELVCQDIHISLDTAGYAELLPQQVYDAASSGDNCGTVSLTGVVPSGFSCAAIGPHPVVLSAQDDAGNEASCQAVVTVDPYFGPLMVDVTPETCGQTLGGLSLSVSSIHNQLLLYSVNGGATFQFSAVFPSLSSGTYAVVVQVPGTAGCTTAPQAVFVPAVGALDNTWTGGGDGVSWGQASNWSLGIVPVLCHNIFVTAGAGVVVPAGLTAVGNTLQEDPAGELTVEGAAELLIGQE